MKKIVLPIIALALTFGMAFAEDASPKREPLIPSDVKEQVVAARTIHHTNMVAERDRFRAEMEKILAAHPQLLAKIKERWVEEDKKMEDRKENREDRREDRKDRREERREHRHAKAPK